MLTLSKEHSLFGEININKKNNLIKANVENVESCAYFLCFAEGKDIFFSREMKPEYNDPNSFVVVVPATVELLEKKCVAKVLLSSGGETIETNSVPVVVDKNAVLTHIDKANNEVILQLSREVADLRRTLKELFSSLVITKFPEFDPRIVEKGMVLTALNNGGPFVFAHAFVDNIKEINGKKGTNHTIELNAGDILYGDKSIAEILAATSSAISSMNENISALANVIQEQNRTIGEMQTTLADYNI